MADCEDDAPVYLAISNIPAGFRSADLRNYFSQFIEGGGFQCFHYRHRPEILREPEGPGSTVCGKGAGEEASCSLQPDTDQATTDGTAKKPTAKSCCCVVAVDHTDADRLVRMYSGNHWINSKGNWLARRCVIRRIKVSNDEGQWLNFVYFHLFLLYHIEWSLSLIYYR